MKHLSAFIPTILAASCLLTAANAQSTGKGGQSPDQTKQIFELLAMGRPYVDISTVGDPVLRQKLFAFVRTNGIRNAKLTLEDFRKFAADVNKQKSPTGKTERSDQKKRQRTDRPDPSDDQAKQLFSLLSKGMPYVDISSIRNPVLRAKLLAFVRTNRIRGAKLTLQDFRKFAADLGKQKSAPAKTGSRGKPNGASKSGSDRTLRSFMALSGGKNVLDIDSVKDSSLQERMRQFAKAHNITNGQLSLDQFRKLANWHKSQRDRDRRPKESNNRAPAAIVIGKAPAAQPVYNLKNLPKELPDWFFELDAHPKDGQVSLSEWRKGKKKLKGFSQWDSSADGLITAKEVLGTPQAAPKTVKAPARKAIEQMRSWQIAYTLANRELTLDRVRTIQNRPNKQPSRDRSPLTAVVFGKVPASKPVYTLKNLPKDLPDWFFTLDANPKDGQVSLLEWRKGKKELKKFQEWDPNDDGLITPIEVLQKLVAVPQGESGVIRFEGALSKNDPVDRVRRNCHHRVHTIYLRAGHKYQIDLAGGFDPYLRLEDGLGKNLAQDDDGGPGLHSRIHFRPTQTGVYRIIATSCSGGRTGAYKLSVTY